MEITSKVPLFHEREILSEANSRVKKFQVSMEKMLPKILMDEIADNDLSAIIGS
jgi:hypothetical protein